MSASVSGLGLYIKLSSYSGSYTRLSSTGAPQGSMLSSALFLYYTKIAFLINDVLLYCYLCYDANLSSKFSWTSDSRHQFGWCLSLNPTHETLRPRSRSDLLISMQRKDESFHLFIQMTTALILRKSIGMALMKNHLLRSWYCLLGFLYCLYYQIT